MKYATVARIIRFQIGLTWLSLIWGSTFVPFCVYPLVGWWGLLSPVVLYAAVRVFFFFFHTAMVDFVPGYFENLEVAMAQFHRIGDIDVPDPELSKRSEGR